MMRHITEISVNLLISLSNKIVSSGLKEMVTVASSEMEGDAAPEPSECVVELSLFISVFLSVSGYFLGPFIVYDEMN